MSSKIALKNIYFYELFSFLSIVERYHLLFGFVVTEDRVADEEVSERNDGHGNKLIPTVLGKLQK